MRGTFVARSRDRLLELPHRGILLLILSGSLLLRLPFFFRDYIDRDESTFILVAQSLVDGHLPYTELWDLKPPVLFFLFAAPIWLFGKSMVAIRAMGWLAVSAIAFYTYLTGKQLYGKAAGVAAGFCCMLLMSLFNSVQGVMSEHLGLAFLVPSVYLMVRKSVPINFFLAGIGMGLSVLCKSNISVALLLVGAYLMLSAGGNRRSWVRLGLLVLGGALCILASAVPYVAEGQGGLWWGAVVKAPLAYSGTQEGAGWKQLPFYAITAGLLLWALARRWLDRQHREERLLLVLVAGILLSFLAGGKLNGHYLLQFYPFFLILLFGALERARRPWLHFFVGLTPLLFLLAPAESYLEYANVARNYAAHGRLYNGEGVDVPHYLQETRQDAAGVLFLEYHIGYWFLDKAPPSPAATHPSNITRPELFPYMRENRRTSEAELEYLLGRWRPEIVVTRQGKSVFDGEFTLENALVRSYLGAFYQRDTVIGRAEIYRKL